MSLSEITPFITIFGPIATVVTVLDFILNDDTKCHVSRRFVSFLHIARRPLTRRFYLTCLIGSTFCTFVVILASGAFQFLSESVAPSLIAFKATGPLLLAIALKILVFDYFLAVKSAFIYVATEDAINNPRPKKKLTKRDLLFARGLWIACDLAFSAAITAYILFYAEHFQSLHAEKVIHADVVPKSVTAFFDDIHLVLKSSISDAHFLLNGSLLFYFFLGLSLLVENSLHRIDMSQIQKNIFKLIGALTSLVVLVAVVSYKVAAR